MFEILAAPLDNPSTSVKGGPWTEVYEADAGNGQMVYGMLEVDYSDNETNVTFKALDVDHNLLIQAEKIF